MARKWLPDSLLLLMLRLLEVLLQDGYGLLLTALCGLMLGRTSRDHSMMPWSIQNRAVASFAILEELRDACNCRRARTGILRDLSVRLALRQLFGHLKALTPCLEFGKSANITHEVRHLLLRLALRHSATQSLEPRFFVPAIVGETAFAQGKVW